MNRLCFYLVTVTIFCLLVSPAFGATIYNNLTPTSAMGIATRPAVPGGPFEIEGADDFFLTAQTLINSASFVGVIVPGPNGGSSTITDVVAEMYRIFPADSNTTRTPNVLTRANSPSDVDFASKSSDAGAVDLHFFGVESYFHNAQHCPAGRYPSVSQSDHGGQWSIDWCRGSNQCDIPLSLQPRGRPPLLCAASGVVEWRDVLLALGVPRANQRPWDNAVSRHHHRPPGMDSRCCSRPRLVACRHRHRGRHHPAHLQYSVFPRRYGDTRAPSRLPRPDRPRAHRSRKHHRQTQSPPLARGAGWHPAAGCASRPFSSLRCASPRRSLRLSASALKLQPLFSHRFSLYSSACAAPTPEPPS